jgi:predicted Zn-ribbon and HTH transcriptional regulator
MLTNPSIADDESKAVTYAAIFAVVFIALNAFLLIVALRASRRAKEIARTKKCASCGSIIDRDAAACPECRSVQVDEDTYLEPKKKDDTVRPKQL